MTTWIVLFRGINVGGKNILPIKELATLLEDNGYSNVRTYIQSGNVVLQSRKTSASDIAGPIGDVVFESQGFRPSVIVLSPQELQQAVDSNPFPKAQADPRSLHLSFLAELPTHPDLQTMNSIKSPGESFVLKDKVFYFHAPDGIGRSRLAARAERLLGVDATGRNWRTVNKILQLASEYE